jgi:WS/DGAT C-terminal domain
MTLKQYFLEQGDEKTDQMMLMMPFNIRTSIPLPNDKTLENKLAGHPYLLPLSTDFNASLRQIHRDLLEVKKYFFPLSCYYITTLMMKFPASIAKPLLTHYAAKPTLSMTNVFGPPFPVSLGGSRSCKVLAYLPSMADISGGFALISHCDSVKISFVADEQRCQDAEKIIKMLEKNLD